MSYLASRVAAAAIHKRCKDARILMVLRDPADRLFSHYAAAIAARSTRETFADWLRAAVAREKSDAAPIGPVAAGRYGANLQRYLAVFPSSRIHIVWHEDYVADAAAAVRGIFAFLGVDETQVVPANIRRNETRVARWRVLKGAAMLANLLTDGLADRIGLTTRYNLRPSPTDRALAIELYEDDIRVLGGLTGRDLGRWLRPVA
ncbi:MAG TPA: sulfotransferase domain-containing protein [Vicinamibacterales bacterium]|nr:sulfotransferase domain-containing protein [Vicinamibacterales bacterium]